jgi:thiosulfate/3-mercaptopyruvate sulfurtransferase
MKYTTLIDTETLALHLADQTYAIVDCRFDLKDTEWGLSAYRSAHIPSAVYADLDRDLSGAKTGANGRHPLPSAADLAKTFSRLGIDENVQVVAYDENNAMFAARLWWLLRWMGHEACAVLDGGLAKWTAEGRPTTSGSETRSPRRFVASPRREMFMTSTEVADRTRDRDWMLLDARAPERFRGEIEPLDRVAGHIPGAVNRPYTSNLDERGIFLPADTLRRQFEERLAGTPASHVVCYCGSGVTACHHVLALEHAGLHDAKLYPGSWSEWSSDPDRPVARGDKTTDD